VSVYRRTGKQENGLLHAAKLTKIISYLTQENQFIPWIAFPKNGKDMNISICNLLIINTNKKWHTD
jgi:hypothetical protein